MALINEHFLKLQSSYLFSDIAKKGVTSPIPMRIILSLGCVTLKLFTFFAMSENR